MNYTEHKITLDVNKTVSQTAISVKKGDTGRRLLIHLAERGYPYHLSPDCYAVFTAKKPDGKVLFNNCSVKDCVIIYDFTAQTVAAAGMMECEIILYGFDGKQLTSASFNIIVEDTIYDTETEIESTDEYNALSTLIAQVHIVISKGLAALPIVREVAGEVINLSDASDKALQGLRIFGKSTQDGTPTLEAPVEIVNLGAAGEIAVKVAGRNLLANKVAANITDKITVTSNADGTMTLKGTTTGVKQDIYLFGVWGADVDFGVRGPVTFSVEGDDDLLLYIIHKAKVVASGSGKKAATLNVTDENYITGIFVRVATDVAYDETIKVMLSAGTTAPEWEPYKEPQVLTLATPSGLPGIPVDSGGNYTDADGQEWICDEIDLARDVYVQRVRRVSISAFSSSAYGELGSHARIWLGVGDASYSSIDTPNGMSNIMPMLGSYSADQLHFYMQNQQLWVFVPIDELEERTIEGARKWLTSKGAEFLYILKTPIETVLSSEDIAAFSALHTYNPNTRIYNDAGAFAAVEYVADTKLYIDRAMGVSPVRLTEITLSASKWTGSDSLYSQVVTIDGITEYSKVDLLPSVEQLAIFHNKDVAFVTENEDGVLTVFAIGDKPTNDYIIQASITEVAV